MLAESPTVFGMVFGLRLLLFVGLALTLAVQGGGAGRFWGQKGW